MWYLQVMRLVDDIRVKTLGRAAISKFCRSAAGFAILGLPLWLAGCSHVPDAINPVAWYRDVSGNSKSDVKDQQGRNQNNLAAGSDKAYPNLATVPDEPDRVLSGIDRDKLQESLIADRNNAKYSGDQLEAGRAASPGTASPAAAPQPQTQADAAPTPAQQSAMIPPVTADRSIQTSPVSAPSPLKPAAPAAQNRQNGSEQPPAESSLQTPEVRSVPQGETPPPPPQPANISQPPAPVKSAAANPVQLTQPSAAERQIQTPPVERPAQSSLALRTPNGSGRAMSVSVGDITFATGSAALPAAHTGPLSDIAGLYKQAGGRIRVIGHAEQGAGGDAVQRQVASLDLALDRANAVAQALAATGRARQRDFGRGRAPRTAAAKCRAPKCSWNIDRRTGDQPELGASPKTVASRGFQGYKRLPREIHVKPPLKIAIAGLGTVGTGVAQLLARNGDLIAGRAGRRIELARGAGEGPQARSRRRSVEAEMARGSARTRGRPRRRCGGRADRRHRGRGARSGQGRAIRRQARRHRQQGACWRITATSWRALAAKNGVALGLRGGGRRRHSDPQGAARGPGRQHRQARLRHPQRHLQLHPDADARQPAAISAMCWRRRRSWAMPRPIRASTSTASTPRTSSRCWRRSPSAARSISRACMSRASATSRRSTSNSREELGYRIKLLGLARLTGDGLEQRVHPCMVPKATPIAHVEGVFNAVVVEGDFVGRVMLEGRGAGAEPTASAVVADLIDIAVGPRRTGLRQSGGQAQAPRRWRGTRAPIICG